MDTNRADEIIKTEFDSLGVPGLISSRFNVWRLSDYDGKPLHQRAMNKDNGYKDEYVFWIIGKTCDEERKRFTDRRAVGAVIPAEDVSLLNPERAKILLGKMVDVFLERAVYFDEGGLYPEPIAASEYCLI